MSRDPVLQWRHEIIRYRRAVDHTTLYARLASGVANCVLNLLDAPEGNHSSANANAGLEEALVAHLTVPSSMRITVDNALFMPLESFRLGRLHGQASPFPIHVAPRFGSKSA